MLMLSCSGCRSRTSSSALCILKAPCPAQCTLLNFSRMSAPASSGPSASSLWTGRDTNSPCGWQATLFCVWVHGAFLQGNERKDVVQQLTTACNQPAITPRSDFHIIGDPKTPFDPAKTLQPVYMQATEVNLNNLSWAVSCCRSAWGGLWTPCAGTSTVLL